MDAVSYPDPQVTRFIGENLIPLRVQSDARPVSVDFNIHWTPTLVTLDSDGKEHHRTLGFFAPEQLIPSLLLGVAKVNFDGERYQETLSSLETLLSDYPQSDATPEAIYLQGVSLYKSTHSPGPLKESYELLKTRFPSSEWTRRAYPYSLL